MSEGRTPLMTEAHISGTYNVCAFDEIGQERNLSIAAEHPLTIYVDKQEIVTLMTLGAHPELLTLGYLLNQGLIDSIDEVASIQVDWEVEAAAVVTRSGISDLQDKLAHRTVTTGCGQGTLFGSIMEKLQGISLKPQRISQSQIYQLLQALHQYNEIYKNAGAVHGCALCCGTEVLDFVEDVGRHNAVDTLAGRMLLQKMDGQDKIFYTTGRLTSEMVMKVAQMGIPTLLSRSGVTQMGFELAQTTGITLIGRAKGKHFLIFNGKEQVQFDAD